MTGPAAMSQETIRRVRQLAEDGLTAERIAKEIGRGPTTVRRIARVWGIDITLASSGHDLPPAEAERLRLLMLTEHEARPRHGVCRRCHTTHPLAGGRLRPHLFEGDVCDQLSRPPITD